MTRGYQGIKAYYLVFANVRFMFIAWELLTLRLSNAVRAPRAEVFESLKLGLSNGSLRSGID